VSACAECGSALAADQSYCLSCGARRGPRAPALERILADLRPGGRAWEQGWTRGGRARGSLGWARGVPAPVPTPAARRTHGALPGPRTAAVLTLAMLAFGTLTGVAASNPSGALRALRRGPLTLLVPAPAPVATTLAAAPPPVEASSTPEPVAAPPATESTPAKSAPASSKGAGNKKGGGSTDAGGSHLPPVKHVFLIVLADQPYAQSFGPESPAPYLAHTLEHQGELLVRFYAVAHEELPNEIALISGLGPTPATAADCPVFTDILPAVAGSNGQYTGEGCIYPRSAQTVGEQLTAKGLTWRVYAEGMGDVSGGGLASAVGGSKSGSGGLASGVNGSTSGTGGPASPCWHPEFGVADPTSQAPQGDTFATFRDPFTYFDGVLHSPACAHDDVGLEGLASDLRSARTTPTLSYIVPDLCHDGRPTPCAPGAPSGLPAAETFLRRVVPEILASPAYRHGGLLIVTTDQAPATGEYGDSSSCCEQPRFPTPLEGGAPGSATPGATAIQPGTGVTPAGATTTQPGATATQPGATSTPTGTTPAATTPATTTPTTTTLATPTPATTPTATTPATTTPATTPSTTPTTTTPATTTPAATAPPGGVTLPPSGGGQVGALLLSPYVKPGTYDQEPFNDFSLLRTLENLFGLTPLGYAASPHAGAFEASVFSAYSG
jgi:phosphatidylinositol-3-phosphatase